MKKSLLTAAFALMLAPGMAAAMCSDRPHQTTAASCADGQVWDAGSRTCTSVTG